MEEEVTGLANKWTQRIAAEVRADLQCTLLDPPFEGDRDIESRGFWMRPVASTEERRLKMLRQHAFTSLNCLLEGVAKWEPDVIVGYGQGGLIAALSSLPMALEAACRTRVVTPEVLEDYRRAWAGVTEIGRAHV